MGCKFKKITMRVVTDQDRLVQSSRGEPPPLEHFQTCLDKVLGKLI